MLLDLTFITPGGTRHATGTFSFFENVINLISISNNINKNTDQESLFSNKDIKKEYI